LNDSSTEGRIAEETFSVSLLINSGSPMIRLMFSPKAVSTAEGKVYKNQIKNKSVSERSVRIDIQGRK